MSMVIRNPIFGKYDIYINLMYHVKDMIDEDCLDAMLDSLTYVLAYVCNFLY